jgi:hypothetical protein
VSDGEDDVDVGTVDHEQLADVESDANCNILPPLPKDIFEEVTIWSKKY